MNHEASFKRLADGKAGIHVDFFRQLGESAHKTNAETATSTFSFLTDTDRNCNGQYTPELMLRVRRIGPDMRE